MPTITTVGLDIDKSVFQVHGVDAGGQVVIRRQLKRRYVLAFFEKLRPCLVGIEACASSHHWSRELQTLGQLRLMPPAYVKPYVKRQKNDADRRKGLRGSHQSQHAFRANQNSRAAERLGAPSHAPSIRPSADFGDQCDPRASCRVRHRSAGRTQGCRGTAPCRRRSNCNRVPAKPACVSQHLELSCRCNKAINLSAGVSYFKVSRGR